MGGMGEAKLDGTPFNVLMQQAVKLKTHVHKIDRVRFDAWPKFYQNTAFVKDEHKKERKRQRILGGGKKQMTENERVSMSAGAGTGCMGPGEY